MAGKNNAKLFDPSTFIQAGINPKTGLPIKMEETSEWLKESIKRQLRIMDEIQFVNRYKWYNLPDGLDGELIERMLYYRGSIMFFFMETDEKFYALPYALEGNIDVYGRYNSVTPVPFNGTTQDSKEKAWITGLVKNVVKELPTEIDYDTFVNSCVIINDRSRQMGQNIIPRATLQECLFDAEAEAFPLARTALIAHSGIKGMRVNDEDMQAQVKLASKAVTHAALTGDPWIGIIGNIEFQDLTSAGTTAKPEEYLLYMQSLDNYRLSQIGLGDGSLFEKKAHELNAEHKSNANASQLMLNDGLRCRQEACDFINAIWQTGTYVEPSESTTMVDENGDGNVMDETDQSGQYEGEQQEVAENE